VDDIELDRPDLQDRARALYSWDNRIRLLTDRDNLRAEVEKLSTALDIVALREIRQAADLAIAQRDCDRLRESVQRARQEIAALKATATTTEGATTA